MSDETAESETPESETPAPETPESETPAPEDPTQPVETPAPATTGGAAPGERRGVFVPRWLAILIGLVVAVGLVGGGGFWLGRETADDDGRGGNRSERPYEAPPMPNMPDAPNMPDTPDIPDAPQAPQGRQLLGVAVEPADNGAAVARVASGSPADDAGLEVGDVITEVDGETITGPVDLVTIIRSFEDGDEISITYERDGETTTVQVTLADLSSDDGSAS